MASHGATWNFVPLSVNEKTMGEYLRAAGLRVAVVGKTHVQPDIAGMQRNSIDPQTDSARLQAEGGFEPIARHDGAVTEKKLKKGNPAYNAWLQSKGYPGRNPWHDFANSGLSSDGELASGWQMRNAKFAARIPQQDSETSWATQEAMRFIEEQGDRPWCLHLSYIKPHWPYMVSEPYHGMFSSDDCNQAVKSDEELDDAHPVYREFRNHPESIAFSKEEVRATVIPAYMGLVKQVDDNVGELLRFLESKGRMEDTLIVFTSDHGDLLGDHWLGEKEMFYEASVRVPLIVYNPDIQNPVAVNDQLVEAIDLIPTFLDALDQAIPSHLLDGKSLLPQMHSAYHVSREAAVCELDYAPYPACQALGLDVQDARATMICTKRWKMIHYLTFPPQLFDLLNDPAELKDLGQNPVYGETLRDMYVLLAAWQQKRRVRTTMTNEEMAHFAGRNPSTGIQIGIW